MTDRARLRKVVRFDPDRTRPEDAASYVMEAVGNGAAKGVIVVLLEGEGMRLRKFGAVRRYEASHAGNVLLEWALEEDGEA